MGRPKLQNAISYEPYYKIWRGMIARCNNPKNKDYFKYGARGISVSPNWLGIEGYYSFANYVGLRPTINHTIDRINNDGNYEPGNVRWATKQEQVINRRMLKSNTSGYTGVWKNKDRNKWRSIIQVNRKKIQLGTFDTPEEAYRAYLEARIKYFGQYGLM